MKIHTVNVFRMHPLFVFAIIAALSFTVASEKIKLVTQNGNYHFFPLKSKTLEFSVKANENVHIVLSNGYVIEAPHYEIVLGGAGDKESYIRRDRKARLHEHKGSVLGKGEYKKFKISLEHTAGTLRVSNDGAPLLYYSDPNYIPMSYFGITTDGKTPGFWEFGTDVVLNCAKETSIEKVIYERCIQLTDGEKPDIESL